VAGQLKRFVALSRDSLSLWNRRMMRNNIKLVIIKYWYLLFFAVIILFMIVFRVSVKELWGAIRSLSLWQLMILFSIYFLLSGFNILLRKYLLVSLGTSPRLKNLVAIHFTSMAAHYSTPAKLGFPVTILLLKQLEDIPYTVGTTMVLIELVVSIAICGLIGAVGTLCYFSERSLVIPLSVLAVVLVFSIVIGTFFRAKFPQNFLSRSIGRVSKAFRLLSFKRLVVYTGLQGAVQFCAGLNLFLLCVFFSVDISYVQAVVTGSAAFFAGALSMVPMGLGVREGSVLFYLDRFGITGPSALSVVTVQRLLSTGLSFFLGMVFGGSLGLKKSLAYLSKEKEDTPFLHTEQ
jgi:uncharacterized membrane protein YbhN (UPF0104 family)